MNALLLAISASLFSLRQLVDSGEHPERWPGQELPHHCVEALRQLTGEIGAHFLHLIPKLPWIDNTKWVLRNESIIKSH
jgi:hypothetical protein